MHHAAQPPTIRDFRRTENTVTRWKINRKRLAFISLIILLPFMYFLVIPNVRVLIYHMQLGDPLEAEAIVLSFGPVTETSTSMYDVGYTYDVENAEGLVETFIQYERVHRSSDEKYLHPGDTIKILYNPDKPYIALVKSYSLISSITILLCMGAAGLAAGVLLIYAIMRQYYDIEAYFQAMSDYSKSKPQTD